MLRLLARGFSSKEIAARLVIAPKTARNHTEHIYAKIGTSNRAGSEPLRSAPRLARSGLTVSAAGRYASSVALAANDASVQWSFVRRS